jgi:multiple sugar transport system ATP-binding protein
MTAGVTLSGVGKVFPDGKRAVTGLDLQIEPGNLMVLVGPSGCGKTTTLRMTAGLEEISEGEIRIGDQVVNSFDPRERDVAMVFQNYALYPHMSVFDNLAFPLRARGAAKRDVRVRVERVAKLLELDELLRRKPRALSGGQRQRVAMGRAIVREPKVFLMDEPLSNLDAQLRTQMRAEIAGLQRELGVTTMYVTHDQLEAMTMGTRIAVMRGGHLQQCGAPQTVYDEPDNIFVATFIGSPMMNVLQGRIERDGRALQCVLGDQRLPITGTDGFGSALDAYAGTDVAVGVRPEHLGDPTEGPSDRPRLRGRVKFVELLGAERMVQIQLDVKPAVVEQVLEVARDLDATAAGEILGQAKAEQALVTARFDAHARVSPGDLVEAAVRIERLHFFDLTTGRAIR